MEGAYFSNHYSVDDPSPAVRAFVDAYKARYGAEPDSIAASSYDATRLLADAITRAGSTEGKRIRDALASTQGLPGRDRDDHDGRGPQSHQAGRRAEGRGRTVPLRGHHRAGNAP